MLRLASRRLSTALAREPARNLPRMEELGWRATPTAEALGAEIEGADLSKIGAVEVCLRFCLDCASGGLLAYTYCERVL